ncbi:MAG: PTS sugar transporter subunit IIB [Gemmatimonadetes bacterium]|nr:PTS sugar transporter subunit IIB [Gemmatimonadota bacterium]
MAIEQFRIDDRLVHGQVVIGWGQPLGLTHLVIVDDAMVENAWEADLYRMATPPGMTLDVESVASFAAHPQPLDRHLGAGMVLTTNVDTMRRLVEAVPGIRTVTIGGLHHQPGRAPSLPYVFLSTEDIANLGALAASGVAVIAQDLPGSTPVPLGDLVAAGGV